MKMFQNRLEVSFKNFPIIAIEVSLYASDLNPFLTNLESTNKEPRNEFSAVSLIDKRGNEKRT